MTGAALLGTTRASTMPDVSIGHLFMQMVIAIAVIGGGIWAFGKIVQHRKAGGRFVVGRSLPQTGLRVLSRTSLGKDQHLAVVAWGNRQVLVGVSGSTIALLADANDGDGAEDHEDLMDQLAGSGFGASMTRTIPGATSRPSFIESLRAATLRS